MANTQEFKQILIKAQSSIKNDREENEEKIKQFRNSDTVSYLILNLLFECRSNLLIFS